ncbi:MAG: hypothetical protein KDH15_18825, partial [Rhodocyclaceae bacterium]|nr:hypothetical protein [Rhodocyclaceae bacterium]
MSYLHLPRRLTEQPLGGVVEPEWRSSLTQGLVLLTCGSPFDLVRGSYGKPYTSTPDMAEFQAHKGWHGDVGPSVNTGWMHTDHNVSGFPVTMLICYNSTGHAHDAQMGFGAPPSDGIYIGSFSGFAGKSCPRFMTDAGVSIVSGNDYDIQNQQPRISIAVCRSATDFELFVDGTSVGTASAATDDITPSHTLYVGMVRRSSFGVERQGAFTRNIARAVWNRELDTEERAEVFRNLWQLYRDGDPHAWFNLPGGGATGNLSVSGGAQPGGSATPSATVALAGVTIAQPGGSATPAASVALSAAEIAVTGGSANPTATVTLSAAGIAQVAGILNLSAELLLAAADGAQAGGNANLAATLAALASGGAQPGGSATPSASADLQAAAGAQPGGSANPTGNVAGDLSVSGGAQAGGSATPSADADLQASGGAQPGGAVVMDITVSLAATGGAQPGGSASPTATTAGELSVSGGAQAGGSAAVSATVSLTAAGFVNVMATGVLAIDVALSV